MIVVDLCQSPITIVVDIVCDCDVLRIYCTHQDSLAVMKWTTIYLTGCFNNCTIQSLEFKSTLWFIFRSTILEFHTMQLCITSSWETETGLFFKLIYNYSTTLIIIWTALNYYVSCKMTNNCSHIQLLYVWLINSDF